MFLNARVARSAALTLWAGASLCGVAPAAAPPYVSSGGAGTHVNLTIYNGGQSLVHDRRTIALRNGDNRVVWRDVSGKMDATSAVLSDLTVPGGAAVVEQNFDYDLLSPQSLLAKYVGRVVTVVHDGAREGHPVRERATVLSTNDGVVLQYADRIETSVDGHLAFSALPENLRDRPTLTLEVSSAASRSQSLDLAYLTDGLGWSADYVGVVAPDERHMDLHGLVTLTNQTGTTFADARVQLVAGNVHFVPRVPQETDRTQDVYAVVSSSVRQENYFEYHLYTLGRRTTVANNQTKQVALLAAKDVPVIKTLELRGSGEYYANEDADLGAKLKVGVFVTFLNKGGELGIPLPGGTVRLYKNDRAGTSQFLGSDAIDHTPRDQEVRLHVGDSFDVTANKKQTDFKGIGGCTFESAYDVAIANAKDSAQRVLVVEPFPGTWSILAENRKHLKTSSATATWTLDVPARTTQTLTYRARVSLCF